MKNERWMNAEMAGAQAAEKTRSTCLERDRKPTNKPKPYHGTENSWNFLNVCAQYFFTCASLVNSFNKTP